MLDETQCAAVQKLEREIRTREVFRDCRSGDAALQLLNASPRPGLSPLVVASCPELAPLDDDSFGAWVLFAQRAAAQYGMCRAAALELEQ